MKKRKFTILLLAMAFVVGCSDDDEKFVEPQLVAGFFNQAVNIGLTDDLVSSGIQLSKTVATDINITVTITNDAGTEYGVDYDTEPAANNGVVVLTVPASKTSVEFVINKLKPIEFGLTKSFSMRIDSLSGGGIVGVIPTLSVTFEENPTSPGATIDPEVGGPTQPNAVYIDLSNQSTSVIAKDQWDLAFYTGAGFNVILNPSVKMLARSVDKTNLDLVSATDTIGWGIQLDFDAIFNAVLGPPPPWIGESSSWIDQPNGDLAQTAINQISAIDDDNVVYILNRGVDNLGNEKGWLKIRVIQSSGSYQLQYANISATGFTTVDISKNDTHNFIYFNFENGILSVAPEKDKWDISFNTTAELADFGTGAIPYMFNDFVNLNKGLEAIMVMTSDISFDAFVLSNIKTILSSFSTDINLIGSSWRTITGPPDFLENLNTDRFYVIKDPDGNFYKLKFTKLVNDLGERGNPEIIYELL